MHDATTRRRFSFLIRIAGAAALIGVANLLFYGEEIAATLGVFAAAWITVLVLVRPDVRRSRAARAVLIAAAIFALALVDDPGPLDWLLFWVAVASATLLPRHRFTHAIAWGGRLALHGLLGIAAPFRDARRLANARRSRTRGTAGSTASILALPLIGGAMFLALFASANPLIGNAFAAIRFPGLSAAVFHLLFWLIVLLAVWPNLRPRNTQVRIDGAIVDAVPLVPALPLATLTPSLITFNAIFAVQNALDIAFLWSGAPLPKGVTLAEYAHRGAYPLILTALLAGAFVLVASRPGSAGAQSLLVRRLIVVWVAQNVLLVASSILRTVDYIAAFSLTVLRIAALAWMALVAVGLVLIVWRMLSGRSTRWLINANAIAAGVVLTASSVTDLGAIAANWNVRHARTAGDLDLCYLRSLRAASLLPLIALEKRAAGPILRDRAAYLRTAILMRVEREQADWHSWTWRNARRLAAARALLGSDPLRPRAIPQGRDCAGDPLPPPAPAQPAPAIPTRAPLTNATQP